ncbi:hypothetical protein T4D_7979 [Trichinella pseudospiralis]|uniref:Uncharacterized protein n=1 Tax=Trichinella pseudospiralis TaxID=6337 RepID=A0A0V1F9Y7_TRIPS|nr:hypothetical protein T4D_7979 [Trichinella pseudospiralis]
MHKPVIYNSSVDDVYNSLQADIQSASSCNHQTTQTWFSEAAQQPSMRELDHEDMGKLFNSIFTITMQRKL